jgi:hypothetical protein
MIWRKIKILTTYPICFLFNALTQTPHPRLPLLEERDGTACKKIKVVH